MSDDLVGMARSIADRAEGSEQIEAYLVHDKSFEVKVYDGAVESLSSAEPRGAGVRLIDSHRTGFAYTTDLTDEGLEETVARARDNASFGTEDEAAGLAGPQDAVGLLDGLIDPGQATVSADQKVAAAMDLERITRSGDPRIRAVEESVYADSDTTVAIASSTGVGGSYRRTDAWCYAIAIGADGDEQEMGFEFDLARGIGGLDLEKVGAEAVRKALATLGASKIPSGRMPVIFDPYVAGQFLGVLGQALTAEAVQKGRSLFAGKLGERVAAAAITLVDDGRRERAPGSSPWDDEGVPTTRTEVIKEGTLASFLYDTTTARREGTSSTGNASRAGFKSMPHPSPSNLAIDPTGQTEAEIRQSAGNSLLVREFHGVHSGANPVSGDFSVGATGVLLENGDARRPVKEVTIAAPMLQILERIEAVANDIRWLPFGGSYGGSTTLVSEMTVGGLT